MVTLQYKQIIGQALVQQGLIYVHQTEELKTYTILQIWIGMPHFAMIERGCRRIWGKTS